MIRVLLADDHSIVRAGLRRLIADAGDMEVVVEADDGRQAIAEALRLKPDVAVVDLSMPGLDGLEVINRLHEQAPELPVLVLTMHEEEQYVVRSLAAGARGYITKRSAPEQLVGAIRKVHAGGRYLSEEVAEALAVRVARGGGGPRPWRACPTARCRCCAPWPWGAPTARSPRPTTSASRPWTPTAPVC